jgi:phage terminase large subunit-like protein
LAIKKKETVLPDAQRDERRKEAESNFEAFIRLVQSRRVLGHIHVEICKWLTRQDAKSHQIILLPRDHQKSALAALLAAWMVIRNPAIRILYISSTANLAIKQLKFIKDILASDPVRMYWPEMVNKDEAKREKWSEKEIAVDHPLRKAEYIRDPTVFTAGLTTNIVGMHCDIAILDDVVVASNAYTDEGREKVKDQYSLLSSVETANAREIIVGTRYHDKDLYSDLISMHIPQYDENGKEKDRIQLFEVFGDGAPNKIAVENVGDGSGEYLWPRQQREDGQWFGFDWDILSKKKAQYSLSPLQFRAQYYNDPRDKDSSPIKKDLFQYYDTNFLHNENGRWYFRGERLNVFASVDFAYSTERKADYTSIVVLGVTGDHNYYILEIDRFKTTKISEYYDHIFRLYQKWGFRKIRAEVSVAQKVIVDDLRDNYIRRNGLSLAVEEYRPSKWQGAKEERIMATLEPKYANRQIWHYSSGNCQVLEEELIFANPAHDDVKDALASAVDFAVPPTNLFQMNKNSQPAFQYHSRFGGVA